MSEGKRPASPPPQEEDYRESEDEDFNPEGKGDDEGESSSSDVSDDDEGATATTVIKTRSQRLQESQQKDKGGVKKAENPSVDVDSLWASMKEQTTAAKDNKTQTQIPKDDNKIEIQESTIRTEKGGGGGQPPVKKRKKSSALAEFENKSKSKGKVNTLEKSRLDWASFVDDEGIKDELKHHNKGGYLDKQDFLARVESRRDNPPK